MVSGRGSQNCPHLDLIKFFPEYVTITRIDLMERPVDSIAKFARNFKGKPLLHFLGVFTCKGGESIVVEKIRIPCCNGNVGVRRLVGSEEITHRIPSIQLDGVEVEVQKLVDLIKKLNTKYCFFRSNCQQFADAFVEAVVMLLLDNVAAKSGDEHNLLRGLIDLSNKKRPTPYMVARFYCLLPVLDDKNNETHRILENKFEDYLKNRPKSCIRRKLLMKPLEMVRSTDATGILFSLQ